MARSLMELLMGKTVEECDDTETRKIEASLDESQSELQAALEEGTKARRLQRSGIRHATRVIKETANHFSKAPKPVPQE